MIGLAMSQSYEFSVTWRDQFPLPGAVWNGRLGHEVPASVPEPWREETTPRPPQDGGPHLRVAVVAASASSSSARIGVEMALRLSGRFNVSGYVLGRVVHLDQLVGHADTSWSRAPASSAISSRPSGCWRAR